MDIDAIFFIGPQGSGKGTQAKLLAEKLKFFYWEMGGILREVAGEQSPLGETIADQVNRGVLLSDDLLLEVVKSKLASLPDSQGLIFDGIPRRIGQAEFLVNYLQSVGKNNFLTLFIDLPKEQSINRLLARAKIQNRLDDTRETIEYRLEQYEKDTVPVLDFLKLNSRFIAIDGRPEIAEVTEQINQALFNA